MFILLLHLCEINLFKIEWEQITNSIYNNKKGFIQSQEFCTTLKTTKQNITVKP